jgi:hypothetical protein
MLDTDPDILDEELDPEELDPELKDLEDLEKADDDDDDLDGFGEPITPIPDDPEQFGRLRH